MYVLYYASMLQCWHLVWILVRTDHPCLGVGRHTDAHRRARNQTGQDEDMQPESPLWGDGLTCM
jgi:hypothetical protein